MGRKATEPPAQDEPFPEERFAAEVVGATVADLLGIPRLESAVLRHDGATWWLTEFRASLRNLKSRPGDERGFLAVHLDQVARVLTLDAIVANTDRDAKNLFFLEEKDVAVLAHDLDDSVAGNDISGMSLGLGFAASSKRTATLQLDWKKARAAALAFARSVSPARFELPHWIADVPGVRWDLLESLVQRRLEARVEVTRAFFDHLGV